MTQSSLTLAQRRVVESDADAILVLASAGCGKTLVLTERVRFILERERNAHILALTFTNKAAEEMETRLTNNIQNVRSRAFIGTVHSFCLEMIRRRGHLIGYPEMPHIFERDADRCELLIQAIKISGSLFNSFQQKKEKEQNKYVNDVMRNIGMQKKNLFYFGSEDKNDKEVSLLMQEYNNLLASQNVIDYDDIIILAHRILLDCPKIAELYRKQYHYILVDEAQDLNFAHYELIKAICGTEHRRVMMVGDPNQAIYGFNGSDKKYMSEYFPKDFSAKVIKLNENFRSTKAILKAANCLVPKNTVKIKTSLEGKFKICPFPDQDKEADWIAESIGYYIDNGHRDILGKVTENRIAVLARTKYVFRSIEESLTQKRIAYFVKKTFDTADFESEIIRMFDLGLRVIDNPKDQLHFRQLLNILNLSDKDVNISSHSSFTKQLRLVSKHIHVNSKKEIFDFLQQSWKRIEANTSDFADVLNQLKNYLESKDESERDITALEDVNEYRSLWDKYSRQFVENSRTLSHFRSQIALGTTHSTKTQSGVTLGTIHSVKGLEFDIVFLMGMNDGTFPDYRSVNNSKALVEEKNNMYVAMTRAKRLLFITYPKYKEMPWGDYHEQEPSRFLALIQKSK
ncbi:MAG: ATP-dependent helicase [Planctomycetaceae bacterium]|jgi:DNA helicase-2/ATP-dependent DNA helicase PcrA|nr:ATP-dependent helicase [Planctomycetaceae bacterium]